MIYLLIFMLWYLFYVPIHNRMPWSYKKWQARQGIVVNKRKNDWE